MEECIRVDGLSKSYGRTEAITDLDFSVSKGEIFGVIGPDGAGKTTLFRILVTLVLADRGKATVDGFDVVRDYRLIRQRVGYMPGHFSLYPDLTVEENLNFFAKVFNTTVRENYSLIENIYSRLEPFANRKAGALSGGMKQKLALSCALIHKPSVLFLDEPTTGVDPVSRKEFWEMLRCLKGQGITILVSTPYMDEAVLCDRIALIREGHFLDIDTPGGIVDKFNGVLWAVRGDRMARLLTTLREYSGVESCFAFGDVHHVTIKNKELEIIRMTGDEKMFMKRENALMDDMRLWLEARGYSRIEIKTIIPGIEDCYMKFGK